MLCRQVDKFLTSQTRHHAGDEKDKLLTTRKITSSKICQKAVNLTGFWGRRNLQSCQKPVRLTAIICPLPSIWRVFDHAEKLFPPKPRQMDDLLTKSDSAITLFDKLLTNFWRRDFLGRQKLVFFVTSVVTGLARQKFVNLTTFWQVFGTQDFVCIGTRNYIQLSIYGQIFSTLLKLANPRWALLGHLKA